MTGRLMPTRGVPRACRGIVLAGTSGALAVAAHAMAGGGLPDTGLIVLLTGAAAGAGIALADRRSSLWAILGVLGAAQLAMHVLLTLSMAGTAGMAGMGDEGLRFNGITMLCTHAVAVAVSALLLFHADEALFFAAATFARLVPVALVAPPPVPAAPPRSRPAVVPVVRPPAVLLCRANARRGPPLVA